MSDRIGTRLVIVGAALSALITAQEAMAQNSLAKACDAQWRELQAANGANGQTYVDFKTTCTAPPPTVPVPDAKQQAAAAKVTDPRPSVPSGASLAAIDPVDPATKCKAEADAIAIKPLAKCP
jgi:hypothetical protein